MAYKRLWAPPPITQKGIVSTYGNEDGQAFEKARCPFCGRVTRANYAPANMGGFLTEPDEASMCQHYQGMSGAGGTKVSVNFSGPADRIDEESE